MKISTRYEKLFKKEAEIEDKIRALQEECNHPNVEKEYRGSTGNYDPSCDAYWIEFKCPDCRKQWSEDQ